MNERELALRKSKLTQAQVAKELGVSKQTVNDIIKGRNKNRKTVGRFDSLVGYKH